MIAEPEPARRLAPRPLAAAVGLMVLALVPATASARSTSSLPYPSSGVWTAAVRYLRVDRGLTIREKDESAGYVLFDYADGGKTYHGALELVALTDEDGRASTQISVSLAGLPRRFEGAILDGLAAKVRDERGPPPSASRRPHPPDKDKDEKDRDKDRDKDRGRDAAKPPARPDGDGLPRIPTLPSS
jgi:hypothetical protein